MICLAVTVAEGRNPWLPLRCNGRSWAEQLSAVYGTLGWEQSERAFRPGRRRTPTRRSPTACTFGPRLVAARKMIGHSAVKWCDLNFSPITVHYPCLPTPLY